MSENVLTIREFDYVYAAGDAPEGEAHVLPDADFRKLKSLVLKAQQRDEDTLMNATYRHGRDTLQAANYVGVVGFGDGRQIEILPKVDLGGHGTDPAPDGDPDATLARTREIFLRMLSTLGLSQAYRSMGAAQLAARRMPLYEIFVRMFADEAARIVRGGIRSSYVTVESNEPYLHGKLLVSRNARVNATHRERFYVSHDEFLPDIPENRLVLTTLRLLSRRTRSADNARRLTESIAAFDGVGESLDPATDFARCSGGRGGKAYERILPLCAVFLRGQSYSAFAGDSSVQAILFPMETVFESYVLHRLKGAARSMGYPPGMQVDGQVNGQSLFRGHYPLRPDIVCTWGDHAVVLDTKWKAPHDGLPGKSDMYQMYAYGMRWRSKRHMISFDQLQRVILIYPRQDQVGWGPTEYVSRDGVWVRPYYVDLSLEGQPPRPDSPVGTSSDLYRELLALETPEGAQGL